MPYSTFGGNDGKKGGMSENTDQKTASNEKNGSDVFDIGPNNQHQGLNLITHDDSKCVKIDDFYEVFNNEGGMFTKWNEQGNENSEKSSYNIFSNYEPGMISNPIDTTLNRHKNDSNNNSSSLANSLPNRRSSPFSSRIVKKLALRGVGSKNNNFTDDIDSNEQTSLIADSSDEQSTHKNSRKKLVYGTSKGPKDINSSTEIYSNTGEHGEIDAINNESVSHNLQPENAEMKAGENQMEANDLSPPSGHSCQQDQVKKIEMDKTALRRLIYSAIFITLCMIAEFIGGYMASSLAIQTDAAHLLVDLIAIIISILSLWISTMAPTDSMSYGYLRAEVIGASMSVMLIWVLNVVLLYMAIKSISDTGFGNYGIDSITMLITSGIGVVINIIMATILHQPGHSHGSKIRKRSSTEAIETAEPAKKKRMNINVSAAWLHVFGDLVQSTLVFFAAIIIHHFKEYGIADPICTIIGTILVWGMTFPILKSVVNILMQGTPDGISVQEIHDLLVTVPGIYSGHHLRIWAITTDKFTVTGHVVTNPAIDSQEILRNATKTIQAQFNFFDAALQVEFPKIGGMAGYCHMLCV